MARDAKGCFLQGSVSGCVNTALNVAPIIPGVDLTDVAARELTHDAESVAARAVADEAGSAAGGGLKFSVSGAGDATVSYETAAGQTFHFNPHSLLRLTQRGVSLDKATALLEDTSASFRYYHDGAWKLGFYDPSSRLFLGTLNGEVRTVIANASQKYINNLMAAKP